MFNSLRIRILVVIILFTVIPQLLVATIVGLRSIATLEQQALVLQRSIVANVSSDVAAYVREHENELVVLAEVAGIGTLDTNLQQTLLKNLLHGQRVFHELILVDRAGQEQIHLSRTDVVLDSELASRADHTEFLDPVRRGQTYFGPVTFDESIREPLMIISIPIFDQRQGDVVVVLIANLSFKPVWDLLAGMTLPDEGDAYVMNRAGQIVAHRSPDVVLRGSTVNLTFKEGRGLGLAGTDVFLASQRIGFGEQELQIVAEQPVSIALELANTNTRVYLLVVTLSVAAALALAVVASAQIVGPVERLAAAAVAVEKADFSISVESRSKGEIGDLARAFNTMQVELQRMVSRLRQEVNERGQAEADLRKANERLRELDQMRSKFIDDMSHELRTPITNLKLYLDLLARGKPESRAQYEDVLEQESNRLVSLSNGILDFSNLQRSLDQANLKSIDLSSLVAEAVVAFGQMALTQGIELSFTPSEEALLVLGDAEQLSQVVTNLLKNAITYTPSGYVRLSTYQTNQGDPIRLIVEDSGVGLDEEELAHCFEQFYRGRRVGQFNVTPGAGLGLAVVKDIVELHGGRVEVESEIDRGSTFSVYLPAHQGIVQKRSAPVLG